MKFANSSLLLCLLLLLAGGLSAQISIDLRPGFNDELCSGFDEVENTAIMDISNMPPIVPGSNTSVEYYWVVQHELGTWTWQTNTPARPFLLPFTGEYTLRVRVLYISIGNNFPYAAFWSTPMTIEAGEGC